MANKVEVEGGELALQNSNGDIAIIPKDKRKEVQRLLEEGCDTCLDKLISELPRIEDYK